MGEAKRRRMTAANTTFCDPTLERRNERLGWLVTQSNTAPACCAERSQPWKRQSHVPAVGSAVGTTALTCTLNAKTSRALDVVERDGAAIFSANARTGSCVHLGPDGCTVYEHRPQACRITLPHVRADQMSWTATRETTRSLTGCSSRRRSDPGYS